MKLIHVGVIHRPKLGRRYLFLRKVSDIRYTWFEVSFKKAKRVERGLIASSVCDESVAKATDEEKNELEGSSQPATLSFLKETSNHRFEEEEELSVSAPNIEEALRLAHRHFKDQGFCTLNCGFRYSLPERDEHGMNALFSQMVASQISPGGIYFDEELGHTCFVQNSSLEALNLWRELQRQNKL